VTVISLPSYYPSLRKDKCQVVILLFFRLLLDIVFLFCGVLIRLEILYVVYHLHYILFFQVLSGFSHTYTSTNPTCFDVSTCIQTLIQSQNSIQRHIIIKSRRRIYILLHTKSSWLNCLCLDNRHGCSKEALMNSYCFECFYFPKRLFQ
jgi:hypothetical protein